MGEWFMEWVKVRDGEGEGEGMEGLMRKGERGGVVGGKGNGVGEVGVF